MWWRELPWGTEIFLSTILGNEPEMQSNYMDVKWVYIRVLQAPRSLSIQPNFLVVVRFHEKLTCVKF